MVPFAFGVEKAEPVWRSQHLRRGPSTKYSLTGGWTPRMVEAADVTGSRKQKLPCATSPCPTPERHRQRGGDFELGESHGIVCGVAAVSLS